MQKILCNHAQDHKKNKFSNKCHFYFALSVNDKSMIKKILLYTLLIAAYAFGSVNTAAAASTYSVQSGDSLWKIAVKYQVGLSEIIAANSQIKNPALIYPGQKISIPDLSAQKSVESEVLRLTNIERQKAGVQPLKMDWQLQRVARIKSEDMRDKNYFDHQSPTYGSPFDMMKAFDVNYSAAGENIAAGQTSAAQVVNSWMNSPGHRENMLKADFDYIGVGYCTGGSMRVYWTQQFISK